MADWSKPATTDTYTNFLTFLDARLDDVAMQFRSGSVTPTNIPIETIRWNSTTFKWERATTTAGAWADLAATYGITATAASTLATTRAFSLTGDATSTAVNFNGSAAVALNVTLGATTVVAGTYGNATVIPQITVDSKGRITTATAMAALGSMATQPSTGVTITGGSISGTTLTLKAGTGSATEGVVEWVTATDQLAIGKGVGTATFTSDDGTATLSNKTLNNTNTYAPKGSLFILEDETTSTKKARFSMASITAGNTRTWTFPDANSTFVGTDTTQTLTNKTITISDTNFTLADNTTPTKLAKFELSGLTAGTNTFTLPNLAAATLATISNLAQTFAGNTTFSNTTCHFGSSTAAGTYQFGDGATISGATRTINLGTAGVSGSTTNITIGGTAGTSITTLNGQPAFVSRYDEKVNAVGNITSTATFDNKLGTYITATLTGACTISFTNPATSGYASGFMLELTNGEAFVITWPTSVKWAGGTKPVLTTSGVDILTFVTRDGGTTWRGALGVKDSK